MALRGQKLGAEKDRALAMAQTVPFTPRPLKLWTTLK